MNKQLESDQEKINQVIQNINQVIIGKEEIIVLSLVALLAKGHVLLEDVPGVGKTMLVRSLSKSLNCQFKRIQFTPDLLPSDITGTFIYNPKNIDFEFRPGPIFGHIVLADEINRTSPKTQSALLEGMEEKSVTVDGVTSSLNDPFFVMATQNPIEHEGTYPLPEAQLDRFLLKLNIGYPKMNEEVEMLERIAKGHPIQKIDAVISREELMMMQEEVENIYVSENIQQYIVKIISKTRSHEEMYLGVSPRGSIALMKAAMAYAFMQGRNYIIPDDIKYLAPFVLSHRVILTQDALYHERDRAEVIRELLQEVEVPIDGEYNL